MYNQLAKLTSLRFPRHLGLLVAMLVALSGIGFGQTFVKYQALATQGGAVTSAGITSSNRAALVYPSCTVTVYLTGTLTLATLYTDASFTPKSNPFTATSEGYYEFYIASGTYDIRFSGTGIATPFTRSGIAITNSSTSLFVNVQSYNAVPDAYGYVDEPDMVTATNNSTTITSNAKFPSRWVNLTNIPVYLNNVAYTVASCASTSSCTLSAVYSGSTSSYVDLISYVQATVTGSSTSITCSKCYFTTARDAGKKILLSGVNGAAATVTTISSVTSTTVAVVASAPPTSGTVNVWFGTDNTTPFTNALSAADQAEGATVFVPAGTYLLTNFTLPRKVTLTGDTRQSTKLWSTAASGGIVKSIWPSNSVTAANIKVQNLSIEALDTNSIQYGFYDNGGSYLELDNVVFRGSHNAIVLDQSEIVHIHNCDISAYSPTYYGIMSAKLDPATNGSWTKTGAGTTATSDGYWRINTTGANATTYYSKATGAALFYKGATMEGGGVSVSSADNAGEDEAKIWRMDDGANYRHQVYFTSTTARVNGGTSYAANASSQIRLEVAAGGATASLYIDGVLKQSGVAALATTGSAIVGFGDFATTDDADVYYKPFVYYSSAKMPTGVWLVNGADITVGNSTDYTNVIQINHNQINGNFTHIADDGGTDHSFSDNNMNGGLWSLVTAGALVNLTHARNAHEGQQWEAVYARNYKIQGLAGGTPSGFKLVGNTFNNSQISNLPPVRLVVGDTYTFDTNVWTKAAASGYLVEIDITGVGRIYAPNESTPNSPDSFFDTAVVQTITSGQNNYALTPLDITYLTTDASRTVTGFVASRDRRAKIVINYGSNDLVLAHQSASSTAANRIITPTAANLTIPGGYMVTLIYDSLAARWRAYAPQSYSTDLATIAGLTPSNDDILQRKTGAWTNRTLAQYKTDLALNLVENTALSTWAGTTNITTLGTIGTGSWNATAIALAKIAPLTASRAVVSDGSGILSSATTTATEIGYVNGVTSPIQAQIDLKAPLISPSFTTPSLGAATATSINLGGAVVTDIITNTAALDFDLSAVATQDLTIALTGAAVGDSVVLGVPHGSVTTDTLFIAWVSASDVVTVRATRISGTPDPASGTFRVTIIKF